MKCDKCDKETEANITLNGKSVSFCDQHSPFNDAQSITITNDGIEVKRNNKDKQ